MYRVISMLSEEGEPVSVPFLANAATAFRYKSIFGKDLLVLIQTSTNKNGIYDVEFVSELAYIMAMQAKAKDGEVDLNVINRNDMVEWLEQFGGFELFNHANEIMNIFLGNTKVSSQEKKKARKPSAS